MQKPPKIAVLGTVGVPGRYGGFETLAENLVRYHARIGHPASLTVWCSSAELATRPARFETADLRYVPLRANGPQSLPYDAIGLWQAVRSGHDQILLLGLSGALALPLIRLVSRARIVTNIGGLEWQRGKWNWLARRVLRISERVAVRVSDVIIADNEALAAYVHDTYGRASQVITYGGDHAVAAPPTPEHLPANLPARYALALCRIEPENNVHMILEAWQGTGQPLVVVGNWADSSYGRALRARYGAQEGLHLLDPIYEPGPLHALRVCATLYVHGHSTGGTNPALVEMMHFGIPVLAHGCTFNRASTEGAALYFDTAAELAGLLRDLHPEGAARIGAAMQAIARRRYTWDQVGHAYFSCLTGASSDGAE